MKNIVENTDNAGIEMFGNKRMIILDCKYVSDYSEEHIVINLGDLNVKIRGDNLTMASFTYGQTEICGEIVSVEFEKIH